MTRAIEAVKEAVSSPLLETTIEGASHVIINISGDIGLVEANEAASYVQELAGENANIIFGAMYDDTVQDEASITVIATGLENYDAADEPGPAAKTASDFSVHKTAGSQAGSTPSGGGACFRGAADGEARGFFCASRAGKKDDSPFFRLRIQ